MTQPGESENSPLKGSEWAGDSTEPRDPFQTISVQALGENGLSFPPG